jgi:hypothetical protein
LDFREIPQSLLQKSAFFMKIGVFRKNRHFSRKILKIPFLQKLPFLQNSAFYAKIGVFLQKSAVLRKSAFFAKNT